MNSKHLLVMVCLIAAMTGSLQAQSVRLQQGEGLLAAMGHDPDCKSSGHFHDVRIDNHIRVADFGRLALNREIRLRSCTKPITKQMRAASRRDLVKAQHLVKVRHTRNHIRHVHLKTHGVGHSARHKVKHHRIHNKSCDQKFTSLNNNLATNPTENKKLQDKIAIPSAKNQGSSSQPQTEQQKNTKRQRQIPAPSNKYDFGTKYLIAIIVLAIIIILQWWYILDLRLRPADHEYIMVFPKGIAKKLKHYVARILYHKNGDTTIPQKIFYCYFAKKRGCSAQLPREEMRMHLEIEHFKDILRSNGNDKTSRWKLLRNFFRRREKKEDNHSEDHNTGGEIT